MEDKTVKCWGCGCDEFTDETHYRYKKPETCCVKCGRFLADKEGAVLGSKIEVFNRDDFNRDGCANLILLALWVIIAFVVVYWLA